MFPLPILLLEEGYMQQDIFFSSRKR